MKPGRFIASGLGFLLVLVFLRAIYLQRLWTIARIWTAIPEESTPPFATFFRTDTWGTTVHNVYGDIVFLRIPVSPDLSAQIAARCCEIPREQKEASGCGTTDLFRINPADLSPQNIAPCFKVGERLNVSHDAQRRAIPSERNVGGFIATDKSGYAYLVVYRVR